MTYCMYCSDPVAATQTPHACQTCKGLVCTGCHGRGAKTCPHCKTPLGAAAAASATTASAATASTAASPRSASAQAAPHRGAASGPSSPLETYGEDMTKWKRTAWWTHPKLGRRVVAIGGTLTFLIVLAGIAAAMVR